MACLVSKSTLTLHRDARCDEHASLQSGWLCVISVTKAGSCRLASGVSYQAQACIQEAWGGVSALRFQEQSSFRCPRVRLHGVRLLDLGAFEFF